MKILFYMRAVRQLRPYKSIFKTLSARGYTVLVVLDPREKEKVSTETLDLFKKETPGFDYTWSARRRGITRRWIFPVRELRSYRRYLLHPEQAAFYRERWKNFLPVVVRKAIEWAPQLVNTCIETGLLDLLMRLVERLTPSVPGIIDRMKSFAPDVVLVAYRNMPSAALDAEYLKAAKSLGIPTVIPVLSWDTFTTKGLIQIPPDRVLVWNEEQVDEIRVHHQIPREKVGIVGAFQFDSWLDYRTPTISREQFCALHGLRAEDPILLYFGFSYGIKDTRISGGHGPVVVEKLRKALDEAGDPALKKVQIIVRPHPQHTHQFADLRVRDAIVLPKTNTLMNRTEDFDLLFDTAYHSFGAIAINTTAIIDISIHMRPGIVLSWPEYQSVQGGTHFKNFLATGAVAISHSPRDFGEIVSGLLHGSDPILPARKAYFKKYIRPHAPDRRASEYVADEIEKLVGSSRAQ